MLDELLDACRRLWRAPRLAVPIVLLLALGVGANGALISIAESLLRSPSGVVDPQRLVALFSQHREQGYYGSLTLPDFHDYRTGSRVFDDLAVFSEATLALRDAEVTETVIAELVSDSYFSVLGVSGFRGRAFDPGEVEGVAVLADALWRRRFAADPEILGETIRLNGRSFTVVGIAPAGFRGVVPGRRTEAWLPLDAALQLMPGMDSMFDSRGSQWLTGIGRLARGIGLEQARRELAPLDARIREERADALQDFNLVVEPAVHGAIFPADRIVAVRLLTALGSTTGLLLLIVAVSTANLLLVRTAGRARELAVRLALGAGRGRVWRGFLAENTVLALAGAGAGIAIAHLLLQALVGSGLQRYLPMYGVGLEVSAALVLALFLLALLTASLAGAAPALQALAVDLRAELTVQGSVGLRGIGRRRLWNGLVIAEVALAVVLLVGATLVLRAWWEIRSIDLGFEPGGVHLFTLDTSFGESTEEEQRELYRSALERLWSRPGIEAASLAATVPLAGRRYMGQMAIEGYERRDDGSTHNWVGNVVAPGYFQTLGIPLLRGRGFGDEDGPASPGVVVISASLAAAYMPGEQVIGRSFSLLRRGVPQPVRIVGVAADSWHLRSWRGQPGPHLYLPLAQRHQARTKILVKSDLAPSAVSTLVRDELRFLAPDLPLAGATSYDDLVASSLARERATAVVLAISGSIAFLLAGLGLYATLSFVVARRTGEIGIRMALGAGPGAIFRMVTGSGFVLTALGLAAGLAISTRMSSLLADTFLRVKGGEPAAFLWVALLVLALSLAASFLPARSAASVDPLASIRWS